IAPPEEHPMKQIAFLFAAAAMGSVAGAADSTSLKTHTRWTTALAFSPDGKLLASVGGESLLYRAGDVCLWDPTTGEQKAKLDGHEKCVWAVAISADGKTLATGDYGGTVKLWDVAQAKEKASFDAH